MGKGNCCECGKKLPSRRRLYCSDKCRIVFVSKHVKVWQWFREEIFDRDNWKCVVCGVKVHLGNKPLDTRAECDHILAVCHGGDFWDKDNLRTLCYKCHKIKTFRDVKKLHKKNNETKEILNSFDVDLGLFFAFHFNQNLEIYLG